MVISRKGTKPHQIYIYAEKRKAYDRGEIIAHREKENALVLHHAKRRKAYVRDVFIAHRVKENIGYFTQRHKGRSLSSTCKEAQRPTNMNYQVRF
jgi:hypothetical protein